MMKKSIIHGAVLAGLGFILLLSLSACSNESNDSSDKAESEVRAREIAFARTMEDRDFEAFFKYISNEAVFFNGNESLRGHEAIARVWEPYFKDESAPFSWHPDVIEVLESGQLALSSGPVRSESGEIIGRYNSIWRKEKDGHWRVVFDKGS